MARSEGNAGAWAAAAVVLALGGLGFGVVAQVRLSHLEDRVARIEAAHPTTTTRASRRSATTTSTGDESGGDVDASGQSTTTGRAPLDEEAARESVMHAYETVYSGASPADARLAFIDDPTGVAAAFRAAAGGQLAAAATTMQARVDSVTFTSSVEASVGYAVIANGQAQFDKRVGTARYDNGIWKVTRSTVCADRVGRRTVRWLSDSPATRRRRSPRFQLVFTCCSTPAPCGFTVGS